MLKILISVQIRLHTQINFSGQVEYNKIKIRFISFTYWHTYFFLVIFQKRVIFQKLFLLMKIFEQTNLQTLNEQITIC